MYFLALCSVCFLRESLCLLSDLLWSLLVSLFAISLALFVFLHIYFLIPILLLIFSIVVLILNVLVIIILFFLSICPDLFYYFLGTIKVIVVDFSKSWAIIIIIVHHDFNLNLHDLNSLLQPFPLLLWQFNHLRKTLLFESFK